MKSTFKISQTQNELIKYGQYKVDVNSMAYQLTDWLGSKWNKGCWQCYTSGLYLKLSSWPCSSFFELFFHSPHPGFHWSFNSHLTFTLRIPLQSWPENVMNRLIMAIKYLARDLHHLFKIIPGSLSLGKTREKERKSFPLFLASSCEWWEREFPFKLFKYPRINYNKATALYFVSVSHFENVSFYL